MHQGVKIWSKYHFKIFLTAGFMQTMSLLWSIVFLDLLIRSKGHKYVSACPIQFSSIYYLLM